MPGCDGDEQPGAVAEASQPSSSVFLLLDLRLGMHPQGNPHSPPTNGNLAIRDTTMARRGRRPVEPPSVLLQKANSMIISCWFHVSASMACHWYRAELRHFESRRITPANRITSTFTRPYHPGLCTRLRCVCRRCLLVEEEVPLGDILDSTSLAKTVGLVPRRLDPYISSFGWRYRDEKPKLYLLVTLVCLDTTNTCLSGLLRTQSGGVALHNFGLAMAQVQHEKILKLLVERPISDD